MPRFSMIAVMLYASSALAQQAAPEGAAPAQRKPALTGEQRVQLVAASSWRCGIIEWRKETVAAIAREHRYSDETGVVDLGRLNDLKHILELIDATNAEKATTSDLGPLVPCTDSTVARVAACLRLQVGGGYSTLWTRVVNETGCAAPELAPYLAAAHDAR